MVGKLERGRPAERSRIVATPEPVITGDQPSPPVAPVEPETEGGINKFVDAVPALPIAAVLSGGGQPTLEDCERQITVVSHQWLIATGEALQYIHDGELWRTSTDVLYDSWTSYLRHRWDGMTLQRAHQLMKAVRPAKAVSPVADSEIKEGHTRVLGRVFDRLNDEGKATQACQEVWLAAAANRRPSAKNLERIAIEKGYLTGPSEPDLPQVPLPAGPLSPALVRYQRAISAFEDLRGLRQIVKDEPAAARAIAGKLREALAELEADLSSEE